MFSGIVETIGVITTCKLDDGCKHFTITPLIPFTDLKIGDSVAVNGVCLTVTSYDETAFNVTAVPETLRLTNLHALQVGSKVNLERAITLNTRIGGHQVQGHVDGIGTIVAIEKDNSQALLVKISCEKNITKYMVRKGFVTLDGMSITLIDVAADWFTVTFIPHTQAITNVTDYYVGQTINIEVDVIGKYLEKWLQPLLAQNK